MQKKQAGQTLIEVIAALGISVLILTAVSRLVINALNSAQFSKYQNLATQYAQQGMEIARQQRDADWTFFNSLDGIYCLDADSNYLEFITPAPGRPRKCKSAGKCPSTANCDRNIANTGVPFFMREVTVRPVSSNQTECKINTSPPTYAAKVMVDVYWEDGKCTQAGGTLSTDLRQRLCHKVELVSCLTAP